MKVVHDTFEKNSIFMRRSNIMMLKKISILMNNYVWVLYNKEGFCIIVDPGASEQLIKEINKRNWHPVAILLTHNHIDHVGGVAHLVQYYSNLTVFGPYETRYNHVDQIVSNQDIIFLLQKKIYVFFTPGHTSGHISYYIRPYFFCGDTLFSGGCGRIEKDQYLEMYHSIKFISSFPNKTMLCCAHEYTLDNLFFSMSILPQDKIIQIYYKKIKKIIYLGKSSLPSYLFFEKKINLFLRLNEKCLKHAMNLDLDCTNFEVFKKLRLKKDFFCGAKRD